MLFWLSTSTLFIGMLNGEQFLNKIHRQIVSESMCTTFNYKEGFCLPMWRCPEMILFFIRRWYSAEDLKFILRSQCSNERPHICCPINENLFASNYPYPVSNENEGETSSILISKCGKSTAQIAQRIVGGVPADLDAWPWIAILGYKYMDNKNSEIIWSCGGALVNDQYVITAAHCINTQALNIKLHIVRLGENELHTDIHDPGQIDVEIISTIVHPDYNAETRQDDIALIKLAHKIKFNRFIQPICLPSSFEMRTDDFVGTQPYVAGWGATREDGPTSDRLLQVQVPVLSNSLCESAYRHKGAEITDRQLCAGYKIGGRFWRPLDAVKR